ncbi:hypothetical protein HJG60_009307 [Phyllostomus discolor]|uniref:Uncharacterized protein n=1 Tax=Phyllostomus discolor TaxID=89673 RepID=A0A833YL44_9CHIR|nr:hypothetical protein HJG60_009307 [Phyllostomus discolor]
MGVETTWEGGGLGAWELRSEARGARHPGVMEGPETMLMKASAGFRQWRVHPEVRHTITLRITSHCGDRPFKERFATPTQRTAWKSNLDTLREPARCVNTARGACACRGPVPAALQNLEKLGFVTAPPALPGRRRGVPRSAFPRQACPIVEPDVILAHNTTDYPCFNSMPLVPMYLPTVIVQLSQGCPPPV